VLTEKETFSDYFVSIFRVNEPKKREVDLGNEDIIIL
jgi:hypothetical protein